MKNKIRILLALTLALTMVFGNVLTVVADGEITQPVKVENGKTYVYNPETKNWDEVEYSEAESITVDGPNALDVSSNDSAEPSSFTVTGDVDASWEEYDVYPVQVRAADGGSAEVTVQGNVSCMRMIKAALRPLQSTVTSLHTRKMKKTAAQRRLL